MITLLNGEIRVESIPNEITTFTVTLPELPITEEQEATQATYETNTLNAITEKTVELEKLQKNLT